MSNRSLPPAADHNASNISSDAISARPSMMDMCENDPELRKKIAQEKNSAIEDTTAKDYVCDMSAAPMCRQTKVMPISTSCSELTDDQDCEVPGKIPRKYCRLFGKKDCRQVENCSDLTTLGETKCNGHIIGTRYYSYTSKHCYWQDAQCKEIIPCLKTTPCSAIPDEACEIPARIMEKNCRLFAPNTCREVTQCSDLTPLGKDSCKDSIGSAFCGWAEDACHSYYH